MGFSISVRTPPLSWKRSITGRPERSAEFYLGLFLNGSCALKLIKDLYSSVAEHRSAPGLIVAYLASILVLVIAAISAWQVFQAARKQALTADNAPVLVVSYLAFRIYFCMLGLALALLTVVDLNR